MSRGKKEGQCEGCRQSPRILRQIESGQWVCQTCLREIHGPKGSPKLALLTHIQLLREQGFDVPDDLSKEEAKRLDWVYSLRSLGMEIPQDTPLIELYRLSRKHSEERTESRTLPSPCGEANLWHGLVDVAGTTYDNPDGSSRSTIISKCVIGEQVRLLLEPSNPYDQNAVMVYRKSDEQIGYLPRECAAEMADRQSLRHHYWAFVDSIGDKGIKMDLAKGVSSPIYHIKLLMIVAKTGVGQEMVMKYVRNVWKTRHGDRQRPVQIGIERKTNTVKHFFTKVVGVTNKNEDGSSRQTVIARCRPLEKLVLVHEDENPVDSNAIAVRRQNGEQMGYLAAKLAAEVTENDRQGYRYAAFITAITGGNEDHPIRGVNLVMIVAEPGVSNQDAQEYIESCVVPEINEERT
jgi:hypothetical protein